MAEAAAASVAAGRQDIEGEGNVDPRNKFIQQEHLGRMLSQEGGVNQTGGREKHNLAKEHELKRPYWVLQSYMTVATVVAWGTQAIDVVEMAGRKGGRGRYGGETRKGGEPRNGALVQRIASFGCRLVRAIPSWRSG